MYSLRQTVAQMSVAAALLLMSAAGYAQTFDPDYSRRIPITITNNEATATPTPTSVDVLVPLDNANMRSDRLDLRVGYWNGTTMQEIDSKIFRETVVTPPTLTRNTSVGKTDYASLPAGTKLTFSGQDDASTVVQLPFAFPWVDRTVTQMYVGIDGYLSPGTADSGRQDSLAGARAAKIILPWGSDLAVTGADQGVYFATDNNGPGGSARAIVRWEVQKSADGPIIAKFAAILTPDGKIRFVYGDPVNQTGLSYAPIKVGVGVGDLALSIIDNPTESYTNHDDIEFSQVLGSSIEYVRPVFRLQTPLASGATSAGEYFVIYGNQSPSPTAARDVYNVFDHVVDFKDDPLGAPAPDWDVQTGNTVTVENYFGKTNTGLDLPGTKVGVLRRGTQNHPRATVKAGAMPNFLNPEILAHIAPKGGGEREMAPMSRVVADPGSTNFQGGYGYAVDGFGSNSAIVSYINPATDAGPALMANVADTLVADQWENVLYRVTGDPGLIQGKNWTDGTAEPAGWMLRVNRANADPRHGASPGTPDPIYNQPGTTGMGGYVQEIAMDYIALREIRNLNAAAGTLQVVTPTGPFIQGTVTSGNGTLNPLTSATVTITGTGGYNNTVAVGPNGEYRVSLPTGGTYTVTANAPFHATTTVENVSPTASGATDITLPFVGVALSGAVRDAMTNQPYAAMNIVAVNAAGERVGYTKSDASGNYTLLLPSGGQFFVGALGSGIGSGDARAGKSDIQTITAVAATPQTVNFSVRPPINGSFEIPNISGTAPEGWGTTRFTPRDPAPQFIYTKAQNHTPGGQYSIGITNPTADFESWNPTGTQIVLVNGALNYRVSAWVYFTAAGQSARLRVRTLDSANADINVATPSGGATVVAGQNGVPVNQWYEIVTTVAADARLDRLDNRLYAVGGATPVAGTVYFDDYNIVGTPVAWVNGKVVDESGAPIPFARIGRVTDVGYFGGPTLFEGPFSYSDAQGNFTLYTVAPGEVQVAAWIPTPPVTSYTLPDWGYVMASATAQSVANPTTTTTLTIRRATNVADGSTVSATDNGGTGGAPRTITGNLANAVDNNLGTRWTDFGGVSGLKPLQVMTFDLGQSRSIDQVELWWEAATPLQYNLFVGPSATQLEQIYSTDVALTAGSYGQGFIQDLTPFSDGPTHIFRVPDELKGDIRVIQIEPIAFRSGLGNYSLTELRALSLSVPIPISRTDVTNVLRMVGGLAPATQADVTRLDQDANSRLTIEDAVALLKKIQ